MVADLVDEVAVYAKVKGSQFLIFPQNVPESAGMGPECLDHVDGIAQDDIYYWYDGDGVATPSEVTAEMELHLNRSREREKLVLTVDDVNSSEDINDAYSRSAARGYVPFVTTQGLDRLNVNSAHGLD